MMVLNVTAVLLDPQLRRLRLVLSNGKIVDIVPSYYDEIIRCAEDPRMFYTCIEENLKLDLIVHHNEEFMHDIERKIRYEPVLKGVN